MNVFSLAKGLLKGLNQGKDQSNEFAPYKVELINSRENCCQVNAPLKYNTTPLVAYILVPLWDKNDESVIINGMVHNNVDHRVMLITLSKGYFCTNLYIRWSCDVTSPSTTTQEITNKHHHHGDGAAHPSSGMDSMISHHPRGGRPCACSFQGHWQRTLFDLVN
jgi:hypothetical protein